LKKLKKPRRTTARERELSGCATCVGFFENKNNVSINNQNEKGKDKRKTSGK